MADQQVPGTSKVTTGLTSPASVSSSSRFRVSALDKILERNAKWMKTAEPELEVKKFPMKEYKRAIQQEVEEENFRDYQTIICPKLIAGFRDMIHPEFDPVKVSYGFVKLHKMYEEHGIDKKFFSMEFMDFMKKMRSVRI